MTAMEHKLDILLKEIKELQNAVQELANMPLKRSGVNYQTSADLIEVHMDTLKKKGCLRRKA